jgi:hypothetical protein
MCARQPHIVARFRAPCLTSTATKGHIMKITKKEQRDVLKDIRRQMKHIVIAIKDGDQEWLDIYADQLSATALNLRSDVMLEKE